jgi:AcrR family transcriptional regulator
MSVYHHVANKDEILNGIVDLVFAEMDLPVVGGEWRPELTRRARSARLVLRRHPWAVTLLESRTTPGPATLAHHDAVLGTLRAAGFSPELTAHAYALLDAFVYGFAVQEASLPFEGPDSVGEVAGPIMELMASGQYPHLVEMATSYYLRPGYDFADEFEFGLGLVLDGLARAFDEEQNGG